MESILFAIQLISNTVATLKEFGPIISGVTEAVKIIEDGLASLKEQQEQGRPPSEAEWKILNDQTVALQAAIDAATTDVV